MKDRSIFRDYREDNSAFLRKCFEEDWQWGKIPKTISRREGNAEEEE